jgi:importin-7
VVNLTLQYLTVGIRQARTWKLLQPHVSELMQRVLFPLMCFGDEDQELWDEDPLEYIRKVPTFESFHTLHPQRILCSR